MYCIESMNFSRECPFVLNSMNESQTLSTGISVFQKVFIVLHKSSGKDFLGANFGRTSSNLEKIYPLHCYKSKKSHHVHEKRNLLKK